jgi:hypothetical protein
MKINNINPFFLNLVHPGINMSEQDFWITGFARFLLIKILLSKYAGGNQQYTSFAYLILPIL